MADQLSSVKNHVDGTTTAVVAMKGAVIKAELAAADHICNNVNRGFHTMIRSQISQKVATYNSQVEAKILELTQQKAVLENIRLRMGRDYDMISKRYRKLFNALNASLRQRIIEIDKPVVSFVNNDMELQTKRSIRLLGTVPVTQSESVLLSQSMLSSHTKNNGAGLLRSMRNFISNIHYQDYLTSSVVFRQKTEGASGIMIPMIILQNRMGETSGWSYSTPQSDDTRRNQAINARIGRSIYERVDSLPWKECDPAYRTKLEGEFQSLLSSGRLEPRVKDMMAALFSASGAFEQL